MVKVLSERKDMAKALNFGKYPVLTYDLDKKEGCKVIVMKDTRSHGVMRYGCTLYQGKIKEDDGIFYLLTHATMLTSHVGVDDWLKSAELANAPVIEADQEVAILVHSKEMNFAVVKIVKSGKVDPSYSTATTFYEID